MATDNSPYGTYVRIMHMVQLLPIYSALSSLCAACEQISVISASCTVQRGRTGTLQIHIPSLATAFCFPKLQLITGALALHNTIKINGARYAAWQPKH